MLRASTTHVDLSLESDSADVLPGSAPCGRDVGAVHASHADFVWATLQRLGVRPADLEDLFQEVFVVVHRRLHTFDGRATVASWLFGICLKVAAAHRRKAHVRREQLVDSLPDEPSPLGGPEEEASLRDRRRQLREALDRLDLERRAVFVMFELEEMSCDEIASIVGVPVGTVHSRLFSARKLFQKALRAVVEKEGHQ